MRRLTDSLARAAGVLLALLLAALVAIATAETVAWTLLEVSWAAAEEVEGILLIWFGLLGAAWGIHQRIHLGVEVLTRRLPPAVQAFLGRAAAALILAFGALLAGYGFALSRTVTNTLPATGLAASVQYFPAIVCGVLIGFFALGELIDGAPRGPAPGEPDPPRPGSGDG